MLENYIDWSIAFHKYGVSSDEEGFAKPTVKWIVSKKRKQLSDQHPVRNVVINVKQKKPTHPSKKKRKSKESFIDEAFKNILHS